MILIYSDSQIIDLEWLPRITLPDEYLICHSFEEYVASTIETKIAFTTHRLHCDHDVNCQAYQGFEDKINQLSAHSKLVFTFESELHNFHWGIWEKCHHDNVYWVVPGAINDNQDISSHIIFWGDWFKTTSQLYKALPNKLDEIKPFVTKPRMFDALLGSPKPHRDHVFNSVEKYELKDKFIIPYGGKWNDDEFYAKGYFIYEDGTEIIGEQQPGTAGWAKYYGELTTLSKIIPISVFNDTSYSIIAETDHDNTLSFYSEKTAKPMIARRLFVAFTGYKFLQNLREQGFQTFDGIIDESYDQIFDDTERYTAAFEQVRWLCAQDQQEIYERIKPVVEHNFNHIMSTDWTTWGANKINNVIGNVI
jgi:hypothetical protein